MAHSRVPTNPVEGGAKVDFDTLRDIGELLGLAYLRYAKVRDLTRPLNDEAATLCLAISEVASVHGVDKLS